MTRIDEQHPKEFGKAGFADLLRSRIDAKAPKNPEEARDFPSSGKLGELKTEMTGAARTSAADAGADVRDQAQAAPDQSGIAPKPVTPLPETPAAPPPGDLNAAQAAPKPLPETEVSAGVNAQQRQLDDTYARAKITDDQLAKGNEPTFGKALADKQAAGQMAASAPAQYRATESTVVAGAQAQAVAAAQQQTAAMHGDRAALLGVVTGQQHGTMAADQASRAKVAADLEQIYATASKAVKERLDKLDKDVGDVFDAALADARQAFESYVQAGLDERYSDPLVWLEDKLTPGVPAPVQEIFNAGRAQFIAAMDVAIDHVSDLVADGLNEAKQLSADGRKQVSEAVGRLPLALRDVGREAAQSIGAKFDQLDQTITAKRDQLVDTLAAKYQDGLKQLDDRITALQKEHEGLLTAAYNSIAGVVTAILDMKNLLLKVLAKAIDTIEVIIADPIRFLGNLAEAVGQGVRNFAANILTHLKQGFFEWLFGEITKAGITLPKTWDLKGIFDLVMQILGLTWPAVRKIAVEVVGEPIVRTLEMAAEPIIAFVREGPAGVWNWIKEQLSNLKAMIVDEIQGWVITNVIKAGITWLIGLLNPASAFFKACKAIYDILQFIWTRGKQILEFVNAVVDSVAEIAAGSLGKAAQKVEDALAKAIPVTIGFLAGLLGLGDLSETIKAVIEKIQEPVHAAVKWLITKAVALIKAAGKLLGIGKKEEEKKKESAHPIFDSVKAELGERLGESEDKGHINSITKQLLVEYQDKGLHGLEALEQEDQGLTIVAYGSDHETLETFQPRGRSIAFKATIELSEATEIDELKEQASRDPKVMQLWHAYDPFINQSTSDPYGRRRPKAAGVATSADQGKTLLVRTWNTGNERRKYSNYTHAEHQFAAFLERNPEIKKRISGVRLELLALKEHGSSPCYQCAVDLVTELGSLPKGTASLSFEKGLYVNPDENIDIADARKALGKLRENGFLVSGPEELPSEKPLERKGK